MPYPDPLFYLKDRGPSVVSYAASRITCYDHGVSPPFVRMAMTETTETQLLAQTGMSGLGGCVSMVVVALAPATAPASFAPRSGRHLIGDSVTLV